MKPTVGKVPASVFDWVLEFCRSAYAGNIDHLRPHIVEVHLPQVAIKLQLFKCKRFSPGVEGVVCIEDIHKEKGCMKGVPRLSVSGAYIRFSRLGGLWKLFRYPRKLGYQAS